MFFEKKCNLRYLNVVGGNVKKFTKISRFIKFDQTHPRVLSLPTPNLDTRNLFDVRLRVYTFIFSKSSTISLDVETTYSGVSMSREVGLGSDGLHVDFHKNVNFIPWSCECIF